jgi:hypothetical protein
MRTISTELATACANGEGEPFATLSGTFYYLDGGIEYSDTITLEVIKYMLTNERLVMEIDPNTFPANKYFYNAHYFLILTFTRGIRNVGDISIIIQTITIEKKPKPVITAYPFVNQRINDLVCGTKTVEQIMTLIPSYPPTAINTGGVRRWFQYQMYANGATLNCNLTNFASTLNLKYRVALFSRGSAGKVAFGSGFAAVQNWDFKEIMHVGTDTEVYANPSFKEIIRANATTMEYNYTWYKANGTTRTYITDSSLPMWHLGFMDNDSLPSNILQKLDWIVCEWTQRPNLAVEQGDTCRGIRGGTSDASVYLFGLFNGFITFEENFKKGDQWLTTYRTTQ